MEPSPDQQNAAPIPARWIKVMPAAFTLLAVIALASADYVVQGGDTLNQIAAELGVGKAELIAINGIADPDLIRIGQVLLIPGSTAVASATHVVTAGETLAGIAGKYGASIDSLVSANGLTNPNLIRIGQQILITANPAAGAAPAPVTSTPAPVEPGATHLVAAGETLASIAAQHGTTVEVVAAANGITDPSIIYVGTTLQLTGSPFVAGAAANPSPAVHTVAPGENLARSPPSTGPRSMLSLPTTGSPIQTSSRSARRSRCRQVVSTWVCPVPGARYFNDWGFPRSGGRFHSGNDLFAPLGTAVLAPVSGTIDFLEGPVGGLQFRLYGDDGTTYIGSHLSSIVGTDGYITAGSQVGAVGDTGNAAGSRPHLHFEAHPGDGPAVNPYPTLQQAGC